MKDEIVQFVAIQKKKQIKVFFVIFVQVVCKRLACKALFHPSYFILLNVSLKLFC